LRVGGLKGRWATAGEGRALLCLLVSLVVVLVLVLLVMRNGLRLAGTEVVGMGEMGIVALRRGEVAEGLVERSFAVEVC
jgi:hypothetical protein